MHKSYKFRSIYPSAYRHLRRDLSNLLVLRSLTTHTLISDKSGECLRIDYCAKTQIYREAKLPKLSFCLFAHQRMFTIARLSTFWIVLGVNGAIKHSVAYGTEVILCFRYPHCSELIHRVFRHYDHTYFSRMGLSLRGVVGTGVAYDAAGVALHLPDDGESDTGSSTAIDTTPNRWKILSVEPQSNSRRADHKVRSFTVSRGKLVMKALKS